jgi:hypothetical protein
MRIFIAISMYLLTPATATSLENNEPKTWRSPNGKYAIKEIFYGEGKLVRGIFAHIATGTTATIYPGGARGFSALWSPDSHYIALTTDRTKYRCEVKLFRVEHGKIAEIALPPNMEARNYLSADTKKHLGSLAFEGMHATRWIDNSKIEIVSETTASRLDGSKGEDVAQHFIIELSQREAKIIKTYAERRGGLTRRCSERRPAQMRGFSAVTSCSLQLPVISGVVADLVSR